MSFYATAVVGGDTSVNGGEMENVDDGECSPAIVAGDGGGRRTLVYYCDLGGKYDLG